MEHALDVCGLEPPEPLVAILSRLNALAPEDVLVVRHFREPIPLYPYLEEGGYEHATQKLAEGEYRVRIWRRRGA
ncbi:MAG: DUF2249 domain-containing protein [Elusimicrobia bacterium]|nr:DUF2249 domain-containing protein [Elusimicrobiota bacterium]